MFRNMIRMFAAMASIWVFGVFALWATSHGETDQRIVNSEERAVVYSVIADAAILYQDRSAAFTVPLRGHAPDSNFLTYVVEQP